MQTNQIQQTMKKEYIAPQLETINAETEQMLAASGVYGIDGWEFSYGGIDETGSQDPD